MNLIRLMPLLLCFSSLAQVNIIIEDKTKTGFLLGVNGFSQNTEPVQELMIKGLDTIPNQLIVELTPGVYFTKIIHLRNKGTYKYIVTTNSRDELQLRYRGTTTPHSGIISMAIQRLVPMEQAEPIVTASVKSNDLLSPKIKDSNTVVTVVPTKEIVEVKSFPPTEMTDSSATVAMSQPIPETKPNSPNLEKTEPLQTTAEAPFDLLISQLQQTEFEFEKLQKCEAYARNHTFSIEELKQVFNILSYDNSRLQLLKSIKSGKGDMSSYKTLAEVLDYEISKQQFDEILSL